MEHVGYERRHSKWISIKLPSINQNSLPSIRNLDRLSLDSKRFQRKPSRFPSIVQSVITTSRRFSNTNKSSLSQRYSIYSTIKNLNDLKKIRSQNARLGLNDKRKTNYQIPKERKYNSISVLSGLTDEDIEETLDKKKVHQGSLFSTEAQYAFLKAIEDTIKESIKSKINSVDWNSSSKIKCKQKYYRIVWITNIILLQKLNSKENSNKRILKTSELMESGFNLKDQLDRIYLKNTRFEWEINDYFEKLFDFQTEFELWFLKWNRLFKLPVLHM